jgi:transcriptional regulator with XRE-family HTH domain
MGVSRSTISDLENGKTTNPSSETLHRFQKAVEAEGAYLSDTVISRARKLSSLPYGEERDTWWVDTEAWFYTLETFEQRAVKTIVELLRLLMVAYQKR